MNEKQVIIAKMLELQHLFEKQPDGISQQVVLKIKQAIGKLASNKTAAIDISAQVRPISRFIRDEMLEHDYNLTLEQRTLLFDLEGKAQDIENKFQTAADWILF